MSSKWSFTGTVGTVRASGVGGWTPIPVCMVPNDMQPKTIDRAKIKAGRKTARRNRRKR